MGRTPITNVGDFPTTGIPVWTKIANSIYTGNSFDRGCQLCGLSELFSIMDKNRDYWDAMKVRLRELYSYYLQSLES